MKVTKCCANDARMVQAIGVAFLSNARQKEQEELGRQYKCDGAYVDASDETVDNIYIKHNHLLSDLSSHTVTIFTRTGSGRRHRSTEPRFRYPVVHYDVYTGKLTLNGKRCKPIPEDELDAPKG